MSTYFDTLLLPNEYMVGNNFIIVKPPYMNTSLQELAWHGYKLWFESRYLVQEGFSKIRLRFNHGKLPSINFNIKSDKVITTKEIALEFLASYKNSSRLVPQHAQPGTLTFIDDDRKIDAPNNYQLKIKLNIPESLIDNLTVQYGYSAGVSKLEEMLSDEVRKALFSDNLETNAVRDRIQDEIKLAKLDLDNPETEYVIMKHFNDLRSAKIKLPVSTSTPVEIDVEALQAPNVDNVIYLKDVLAKLEQLEDLTQKIA